MKKKLIITVFLITTIIQAIIPIRTNAFTESREIISVPATIENQRVREENGVGDIAAGLILEPTVELFTVVIDAIMQVVTSFMTPNEYEFVMLPYSELDAKLKGKEEGLPTFTIEDMSLYKNAIVLEPKYPNFAYSPEEIFSGNIPMFDINFIDDKNTDDNWNKIRSAISALYKLIKMMAIIGLLSVLIYTGIKIIISSNAKDKAKYKEMIVNWFVAVILVFTIHYIMAFILSVVEQIMVLLKDMTGGLTGGIQVTAGDKVFRTNLIGLARFQMQQFTFTGKMGHLIIYVALVAFTFKFTFLYFKRVLRMAFLTVIAPIVALTYPIDKMEGKAKGFEFWLKEFLFNALLQPLHYILYFILVSSALTLAARNPLYGIVAIMFVSEGERLLKRIFGFDKASGGTVGGIAGAFTTGAVTGALTNMISKPLGGGNGSRSSGGSQRQLGSEYADEDAEIEGTNEDYHIDSFEGVDVRANSLGQGALPESQEGTRMPLVDDFLSKYRGQIPESELGELTFNDGFGSMQTLLRQIYQCEEKLNDENLPPEQREKLQQKLFRLKTALNNRIEANEGIFNNTVIPTQYSDGDTRTNSQLMDEIRRLWKLSSTAKTEKDRQRYGTEARRLLKKVKRRMAENQYIGQQGGLQAIMGEERFRRLSSQINTGGAVDPLVNGNTGGRANPENNEEQDEGIIKKINKLPVIKGIKNVGKTVVKPIWDTEKEIDENAKNLGVKAIKTIAGVAVGITAATVQAGMSITDGKYNPLEGAATIGAGIAATTRFTASSGTLRKAYREGAYPNGEKEALEDYSKRWYNRDDVIANYNREFPGQGKEMRRRAVNNYLSRGVTDFNEQKQAMKYAEQLKKERGMDEEEADRLAIGTLRYRQNLVQNGNFEILFDKKKRGKYLDLKADTYTGSSSRDSIIRLHDGFIENVRDFDRANR